MKIIIKAVCLISVFTALSGCQMIASWTPTLGTDVATTTTTTATNSEPADNVQPPKVLSAADWQNVFKPYVDSMLAHPYPEANNTLLINQVTDHSGQNIAVATLNDALQSLFASQSSFTILDNNTIKQAKQSLGLPDGVIAARRKVLSLARYLKADYVLFTTLTQVPTNTTTAKLTMQIISTHSGEIIWPAQ